MELTPNEKAIVKNIVLPLGRRLKAHKCTEKLCQILNVNLDLEPKSPYLNLAGIRSTKYDYLYNELQWYLSQDLHINNHQGIENNPIWNKICTKDGHINSNYGYLVFDKGNHSQYAHALAQMAKNKYTKHAVIIYNMVQDDELHMMVTMRSNDLTTGFFNDFGWQVFVYKKFLADTKKMYPEVKMGLIHWHADNMHVYERDYELLLNLYEHYKGVR